MAQLEGIRIQNFRALKDVTLGKTYEHQKGVPLPRLMTIIGPNGCGKSSLLDAFGFIGDCLRQQGPRRDQLVIATKFFANLFPPDPNAGGASRKSVTAACEESLRRLQTDYIDLYWMHLWARFTPIDETMRALDDLVGAGKVRYIGFSDTDRRSFSTCAPGLRSVSNMTVRG